MEDALLLGSRVQSEYSLCSAQLAAPGPGPAPDRAGAGFRESDSKTKLKDFQALAMNLAVRRMEAMRSHASEETMEASQSFARHRQRPNQASVRSTTHRRAMTTRAREAIGALDDLDDRTVGFLHGALQLLAGIAAVGEQMHQRRKLSQCRSDERRRAVPVLMLASCTMPASMLPGCRSRCGACGP